jgi:hypothetical protein
MQTRKYKPNGMVDRTTVYAKGNAWRGQESREQAQPT